MKTAMIAAMGIATLAALFAVQNAQQTQVSFMGWYFETPLVMLLLLTFAAGAATAFLAMLPASVHKSLEIKRLKAQLSTAARSEAEPAHPSPEGSEPTETP